MTWKTILPGVVLLGLVVFVHELGHFLMAKWRGVGVLRFSLGFGPKLIGFTRGGTEYWISWFPLGGYVQMKGDSPDPERSTPGGPDEFLSHPWFGRVLIAVAGPAANLVAAYLVMVVVVGWVGVSYPDFPNRLGAVPDTSVAFASGLREGDRIVAVQHVPVKSWVAIFVTHSKLPKDVPVELEVDRGGRRFPIHVDPSKREPLLSSLRRPPTPPVVGGVITAMPAYKAGLKEGDRILSVNGRSIHTWDELPVALRGTVDREVRLHVRRGDREFDVTVKPVDPEGRGVDNARIGIEAPRGESYVERYGLKSFDLAFRATASLVANVYGGMWLTVSRPLYYREYVGGPLLIAQAASDHARRGLDSFLQFLAMINIAIMAFNLLPLPMLDGGHIVLALLEAVRRQAISTRAYIRFQKVGLVVIAALFVLILANDPLRLVQRQRALDQTPRSAPQEKPLVPTPP